MTQQLKDKVARNRVGWEAIRHHDGWWVGDDDGVLCYEDHELARVALTLIWQRDGGRKLNFKIERFTGADTKNGDFTPKFTAVEAMNRYEKPERYKA